MTVVVTHTTPADSTFSSTGAAAWNADHTLAGVGTMAEQNANSVAITGGTINGTTVGATTPAAGTFTTLTATGQTSLGGVAGSESIRAVVAGTTGNYWQFAGSSTNMRVDYAGASTNIGSYFVAKGTGFHSFTTAGSITAEQMRVSHTASAVNYHQLTGSATGSGPIHSVAGSDTNIDLNLTTKGSGAVNLNSGNGTQFRVGDTFAGGTATNFYKAQGTAGGGVVLVADGASTNIPSYLASKGISPVIFTTGGVGVEQLRVAHTASAVNYVQVTGNATTGQPSISAQGSDTNISMAYIGKGIGGHIFSSGNSGNIQALINNTTSAVNYHQFTGSATGFGVVHSAQGSDTNIPLVLQPKGTGALQAQQTDSTATGGNVRGANVVDLQTLRTSASQVASGFVANIAGGYQNTASGGVSGVLSGTQNNAAGALTVIAGGIGNTTTLSGYGSSYNGVVTGYQNTASGVFNFIGGGFTNSGTSATAVTTQSATMNATTAVTLAASNASIKVGQIIAGTSINNFPPTYVAAISGTSLTLSQVASGSSTSTLSFFTPHGVVVGGGNNQATGAYSVILGGGDAGSSANRNVASGDWSFVGGGATNTASGIGSVICGGGTNGSGNFANGASGTASSILGGLGHTASGTGSSVLGGYNNVSNGSRSTVLSGRYGTTRSINGNVSIPACDSPIAQASGVSQTGILVLARQTTDATATVLASDANAASTTNQVILPNNSAYYFKGSVIANVTGGGNTKAWAIEGAIKRGANAASTALVGTPTVVSGFADVGAATWDITATADTTNGGLKITFTGQAATTIRCVAKLETTEVTF